jgi:DNA modification methylase
LERRFYEIVHPLIHRGRPRKIVPSEDIIDGAMQARLDDWGVSRNLFSRMKQIAAVPKPVFERFFVQVRQHEWEITNATFFMRCDADITNEIIRQRQYTGHRGEYGHKGDSKDGGYYFPSRVHEGKYAVSGQTRAKRDGVGQYATRKAAAIEPTVELHHGDCLRIMPTMQAKSVAMILSDLPYGVKGMVGNGHRWDRKLDYGKMWEQFWRILKLYRTVALFGLQPFTSELVISQIAQFKYEIIWKKNRACAFIHAANMPLRFHENIEIFSTGAVCPESRTDRRMPYWPRDLTDQNDGYPRSVAEFPSDGSEHHPCQKPVALLRWLIEMYTEPGEVVLDCCMGSGSTGVAALSAGRSFIGIEKEQRYFEAAMQRIASVAPKVQ